MLNQLSQIGIIPVIKIDNAQDAVPLCAALARGGLPVAEITLRTPAALEAIRLVHEQLPEVLLGAGTVTSIAQAEAAMAAGASFLVSPGLDQELLRHAQERGYPILPGCASPTDVQAALALGAKAVKFFPAEVAGGVPMLKALSGPFSEARFVPTGGIHAQNVMDYLRLPQVLACGGSWMVPQEAVAALDWPRIEALAAEAVRTMLGLSLRHIGMNVDGADKAAQAARQLSLLTGWPVVENGDISSFVGAGFEVMKHIGRGVMGHIALAAHSVDRARWHLARRGFAFDESTALYLPDGRLHFIYLQEEFAGFAIHLIYTDS